MLADIRSENRLDAVLNVLCTDGPSTFMHIEKAINFPWEEGDVNIKNMDGQIVYRGPREFTDYMGTYISMGLVSAPIVKRFRKHWQLK
jgi:hypothetical protein